jgi:hypothetical protein
MHTTGATPKGQRNQFPGREGIQFDGEVCTPEEQQLDVIKKKILRKLQVRFAGKSFVRAAS